MNTQLKALRLADALEQQSPVGAAQHFLNEEAATELRLLHGRRVELLSVAAQALEALEYAERNHGRDDCYSDAIDALRAAIEQENKA